MENIRQIVETLGEEKYIHLWRFLQERINSPENFVVLLGETSSGKSTIVNGLLQREIIVAEAGPSTGVVIEILDDGDSEDPEYYAISKDATAEKISEGLFRKLSAHPDKALQRLRVIIPKFPHDLKNLRLFDTPGYGSLHKEHDEVLKEFIPNSDVIVYVVTYRVGFKENDNQFMQYIQELIDHDTDFYLVVNRVPPGTTINDKRVQEILIHAKDCLHRNVPCFLISSDTKENSVALPKAPELWRQIVIDLNSPERSVALRQAFLGFQGNLLQEIQVEIIRRLSEKSSSTSEKRKLREIIERFSAKEQIALGKIEETFTRLDKMLEPLFSNARKQIISKVSLEVENVNKWTDKDECSGFIQAHLLPLHIKNETKELSNYIQTELEHLDEEVSSLLNTAVQDFTTDVQLNVPVFGELVKGISNKLLQKSVGSNLLQFFKQFGGAGGAGAGVANAAKSGLKKLGDLFGHTFSRDTHNALAKFLSKIGATSAKAITAAAAVFVEGLFYLYDSLTWQKDLNKVAQKALVVWEEEAITTIKCDLTELKEVNKKALSEFFDEYRKGCSVETKSEDDNSGVEKLQLLQTQIEKCLKEISEGE